MRRDQTVRKFSTWPWLATVCVLLAAVPVSAETLKLSDADCERMAFISVVAPRLSWATSEQGNGVFPNRYTLTFRPGRAFLICYPLEQIPKGQRIASAEWVVPVRQADGPGHLRVRRIMRDWGAGVSYQHRTVRPKKEEWSKPGAQGVSTDAARPSALARVTGRGDVAINVLEDVELWYTGGAPNHGWLLSVEDQNGQVDCFSPLSYGGVEYAGYGRWKLTITFEPK
jgi:hypothetical protein